MSVMPMNVTADGVACLEIRGRGAPGFVAGGPTLRRGDLHAGEQVTNLEAELRVQGQGTVVVCGLHKADPWDGAFGGTPHHIQHEGSAHSTVLDGGVYRDRTDAGNG